LKTKNEGFTLIEALVATGIIAFVVVSVLNAFIHQMHSNKNISQKNVAIVLAEDKLEEYLKFPSTDMPASAVDFVFYSGNRTPIRSDADPSQNHQYRRTVTITPVGNLNRIEVLVEYGYVKVDDHYPFRVVLSTQRGL
jgi:type II secretion system protein I